MAKRYKEKAKKKSSHKVVILLFIILLIIAIGVTIYFINRNTDDSVEASQSESDDNGSGEEEGSKEEASEEKQEDGSNEESASGDKISPSELNQKVLEKNEKVEGGKIIKMHYKLESLDAGNVFLYYRLETGTVYVVDVDISSSKIKSTKKYEENDLENKQEIVDNLSTNINEYFEKYKEKLQSEGRLLNVIITDTEVVINLNYA